MSGPKQPSLFDRQPPLIPRRHKRGAARRVSRASIESFEGVKPKRSRLYLPVLSFLGEFPDGCDHVNLPTAREILREMIARGVLPVGAERNSVSPRLTELLEGSFVENPLECIYPEDPTDEPIERVYLKRVDGDSSASVWRITKRGRDYLDVLRREQSEGGKKSYA